MAVTVNEFFEITKGDIVYIPSAIVSKDSYEGEDNVPVIVQEWEDVDIDSIADEEVRNKAREVWTSENIAAFKEARE